MPANVSPCRSCGARIRWARSATTNALMPLDADPTPDGNVTLDADGRATVHGGGLFDTMAMPEGPRYKSHFATCTDGAAHRKKS